MLVLIVLLIVSLAVLVFGAEILVRGGSSLAIRFGVSTFFVGLTIVAFGTSAPELATGITSTLRGAGDLTVGNVIGATTYNIAVILGITAIISPIVIDLPTVRRSTMWMIFATFAPMVALLFDGRLPRWMGGVFVLMLLVFLARAYVHGQRVVRQEPDAGDVAEAATGVEDAKIKTAMWVDLLLVVGGLVLLVAGSHLLVDSAVKLARILGISELVIGLTVVSFGTAAPELATSILAAIRGRSEIAVGNVVGSGVFNILGILGITTLMKERELSAQTLFLDCPMMILVSLSLIPIFTSYSRITRAEGVLMVLMYIAYMVVLFKYAPGWFG